MSSSSLALRLASRRYVSSVSSSEVLKFSDQSSIWWDPLKNPLVGMNPIRIEYIIRQLGRQQQSSSSSSSPLDLHNLNALDVGCGGGLLSESLARLGATSIVSIDPSTKLIQMAKNRQNKQKQSSPLLRNIHYRGGMSIEHLVETTITTSKQQQALPDNNSLPSFDIVCILEVLEHVQNIDTMLESAATLLHDNTNNPNATLFISTINRTLISHLVTILAAEYIMGYLPTNTHNWNQFLSPQTIQHKLQQFDIVPVDVQGMVLQQIPPPIGTKWQWKLDPNNTNINWIGAYRKRQTT